MREFRLHYGGNHTQITTLLKQGRIKGYLKWVEASPRHRRWVIINPGYEYMQRLKEQEKYAHIDENILLKRCEVMEMAGIGAWTLRRYVAAGRISCVITGKGPRRKWKQFKLSEVLRFLRARDKKKNSPIRQSLLKYVHRRRVRNAELDAKSTEWFPAFEDVKKVMDTLAALSPEALKAEWPLAWKQILGPNNPLL